MSDAATVIKRLDAVLNYLANDRGHSSDSDIAKGLKRTADIDMLIDELLRHLKQLIEDKFISVEILNGVRCYAIITSGAILNLRGGYSQKYQEVERLRG